MTPECEQLIQIAIDLLIAGECEPSGAIDHALGRMNEALVLSRETSNTIAYEALEYETTLFGPDLPETAELRARQLRAVLQHQRASALAE